MLMWGENGIQTGLEIWRSHCCPERKSGNKFGRQIRTHCYLNISEPSTSPLPHCKMGVWPLDLSPFYTACPNPAPLTMLSAAKRPWGGKGKGDKGKVSTHRVRVFLIPFSSSICRELSPKVSLRYSQSVFFKLPQKSDHKTPDTRYGDIPRAMSTHRAVVLGTSPNRVSGVLSGAFWGLEWDSLRISGTFSEKNPFIILF